MKMSNGADAVKLPQITSYFIGLSQHHLHVMIITLNLLIKPIFHQAFFGHVGTESAIDFVLRTFQVIVSSPKDLRLHNFEIGPQMYLILIKIPYRIYVESFELHVHLSSVRLICQRKKKTTTHGIYILDG